MSGDDGNRPLGATVSAVTFKIGLGFGFARVLGMVDSAYDSQGCRFESSDRNGS
jgi:hypothetical protein